MLATQRLQIARRQLELLGDAAAAWAPRLAEVERLVGGGLDAVPQMLHLLSTYAVADARWSRAHLAAVKTAVKNLGIDAARRLGGWERTGIEAELVRTLVDALIELGEPVGPFIRAHAADPTVPDEGRGWLAFIVERIGQPASQ